MAMAGLEYKNNFFLKLSNKGQSTVEYILLLAVAISVVTAVFKSQGFQNLFGEEGTFNAQFRMETEFSYRHGLGGKKFLPETINYNDKHETYLEDSGSLTRFFGAKDPYPIQ